MGKRGPVAKNKLAKATATSSPACVPYKPSKADVDRERRYKAEDALRALQRADEVKKDPRLMGDVKALAQEQMAALKKIK